MNRNPRLAMAVLVAWLGLGMIATPAVAAETPGPGKPIVSPKKVRPVLPPDGKPLSRKECEDLNCKPVLVGRGSCVREGQEYGLLCICIGGDGQVIGSRCIDEPDAAPSP